MSGRIVRRLAIAATSCLLASQAHATLLLTLDRHSDTSATLTISGKLDVAPAGQATINNHILVMDGPFAANTGPNDFSNTLLSTTLKDGTTSFNFSYAVPGYYNFAGGNNTADMYFGSYSGTLPTGLDFTGSLELMLQNGLTFAQNGSAGNVYWGVFGTPALAGTWQMGAPANVPEPASAALLLAGAAGLVLTRRRKN